ncbi:hypothetical protein [Streptomyces sp. NPDC006274]|uniref:hypothetical protein n=1 Tax=unclassified Streptomyces TaxID=2593676 RepID=UPI0033B921AD
MKREPRQPVVLPRGAQQRVGQAYTDTIATYQRVWLKLKESAVFGAHAQHLIVQARRGLALP